MKLHEAPLHVIRAIVRNYPNEQITDVIQTPHSIITVPELDTRWTLEELAGKWIGDEPNIIFRKVDIELHPSLIDSSIYLGKYKTTVFFMVTGDGLE